MKRKRRHRGGHKKEKKIKLMNDPLTQPVSLNSEDIGSLDQEDDDQPSPENHPEPTVIRTEDLSTMSNIGTEVAYDKSTGKIGHGRVKVKLRSSRMLEPHKCSSDAQTPIEKEKSNPQVTLNMDENAVEKEEITPSDGEASDLRQAIPENLPRKTASIKIKSSRGVGSSSESMQNRNASNLGVSSQLPNDKNLVVLDGARTSSSSIPRISRQREARVPRSDPRYNEKELNAALSVIKKIMKMDAAGPFNVPVDPVALGIPDYFDIIDTPMDFGTICNNLEHRHKYVNSEDVYKDVQYIWGNCYKYNNKGDYVVDLMKRVKKNFDKSWLAAGLYSDMAVASESTPMEDVARPNQEKSYSKSKSKHKRRRIDRHKSDCLCAVCVVRRRRKEREENSAAVEGQMNATNSYEEIKTEESSPPDISYSEDAISSLERSAETYADADVDEADNEVKMEMIEQLDSSQPEQERVDSRMEHHHHESGSNNPPSEPLPPVNGADESHQYFHKQGSQATEIGEPTADAILDQKKETVGPIYPESAKKQGDPSSQYQLMKMQDNLVQEENQLILQICSSLFPKNPKSVWNGPHTLNHRNVSVRESPIHAAVATLMKQ